MSINDSQVRVRLDISQSRRQVAWRKVNRISAGDHVGSVIKLSQQAALVAKQAFSMPLRALQEFIDSVFRLAHIRSVVRITPVSAVE